MYWRIIAQVLDIRNYFLSTRLPVMHGSIEFPIYRQIGALIWELCCQLFIDLDSQSGLLTRMHEAIFKVISVRENVVGLRRVAHVLLNAKVVDAQIKMQGGSHAHRTEIGSAVRSGTHLVDFGQGRNLLEMSDSTGVNNGRADVVDELLLNQGVAIVDGVKDLSYGERGSSVAADEPEPLLQFGGGWIFEPEEMIWFQRFAQTRGLNRAEAVMGIMQQMNL